MTLTIYWRLDPAAEAHRGEPSTRRPNDLVPDGRTAANLRFDHYTQIARAAALTGFDGLFVAHDDQADDSQIIAAAVARSTPRLLIVPEFPASVGSAVYAAKRAVSFQRATRERLGWAIIRDGDAATRLRGADPIADDDIETRIEEFLHVARGVHGQQGFTFKGRFFEVENGGFEDPLNAASFPPVFLAGDDEDSIQFSARHADVHLFSPAEPDVLHERVERLDRLALEQDRTVAFGLVATVIARESDEEARAAGSADFVGSFDTVAERLSALAAIGITHFLLSSSPQFEEAYRVGQFVLPRLRDRFPALRAAA